MFTLLVWFSSAVLVYFSLIHTVNIEGIPNYQIPKAFGDGPEFALLDDSDEDDSGEEDNNEDYEIILNNYAEEILLVVEK